MDFEVTLEELALGEASLEAGTKVVSELLRMEPDATLAYKVYHALSSWTWKTIDTRRRGEDLESWMALLNRAAAGLEGIDRNLSVRVEAFSELIQASLTVGRVNASAGLPRGKHATAAFGRLLRAGGPLARKQLLKDLKLSATHLSNVMGPLTDRGFVERHEDGREVSYNLTRQGIQAATRLAQQAAKRSAAAKPAPQVAAVLVETVSEKKDYLRFFTGMQTCTADRVCREDQDDFPFGSQTVIKGDVHVYGEATDNLISADTFPVELALAQR